MAEAAVSESPSSSRKKRAKLRALLARRRKAHDDAPPKNVPAGYRTFSKKLAPGLIAAGGALSLAGSLGTWIRTSRVVSEGLPEEQVGAVMGLDADWGRLMALVAAVSTVASIAWLLRNMWFKLASAVASVAVIGLTAWRLPIIDDQAAGLAYQARTGPIDFLSFHAGFGWGAWCLIVGAVALFLGISVGIMRELDVRRGIDA